MPCQIAVPFENWLISTLNYLFDISLHEKLVDYMHNFMRVKKVRVMWLDFYSWLENLHILMECHKDHIFIFPGKFWAYLFWVYLKLRVMGYNVWDNLIRHHQVDLYKDHRYWLRWVLLFDWLDYTVMKDSLI